MSFRICGGKKGIRSKTAAVSVAVASAVMAFMLTPAFASAAPSVGSNWRVFNFKPATSQWDIDKAQSDGSGGFQFTFPQFQTPSTGSFAVYLANNYNVSLTTSQTITADANWTTGPYATRSDPTVSPGAYARAEFQDVASGNYTSNDYWWYGADRLDLNTTSSDTLTAPLSDRANWTNICGQSAIDPIPHPGPNCVGGTDPAVSPSQGFTNAMKNVKQVSLSFGSLSRYASGVAAVGTDSATFDMTSFTVAP
jgi:hypothetical protein